MANSPKQVMDIRVQKGFNASEGNEHQRNWNDKKWSRVTGYGMYDRTRSALNFEIVKGKVQPIDAKKSIPERIKESLSSRGIKDPNEGLAEPKYRTVVNFIFGGSRDRMHEIAFGSQKVNLDKGADNSQITRSKDIESWAMDVYSFVAKKYGEENIASFVIHLDEMNPHCHCTLLPILNNKFSYKKIFAGKDLYDYKDKMRQLHSEFAEVNEKWGLSRGDSIEETHAKHRTTEEYRRELSHECSTLEENVTNNKLVLKQLDKEVAHAEKRVKGLNTMIANLEKQRDDLEAEMNDLADQIKIGEGDVDDIQKRIDMKSKEYQKTLDDLNDKNKKKAVASRQLDDLYGLQSEAKAKVEEYDQQITDYKKQLKDITVDYSKQVNLHIAEAAMQQTLSEINDVIPASVLANDAAGSFIGELAAHGNNFLKCAALLFAGYVDGATQVAQNCGGGGGGSSQGWGKKDDEDDLQFARRCLFQASRMMRPSTVKSVKRK